MRCASGSARARCLCNFVAFNCRRQGCHIQTELQLLSKFNCLRFCCDPAQKLSDQKVKPSNSCWRRPTLQLVAKQAPILMPESLEQNCRFCFSFYCPLLLHSSSLNPLCSLLLNSQIWFCPPLVLELCIVKHQTWWRQWGSKTFADDCQMENLNVRGKSFPTAAWSTLS